MEQPINPNQEKGGEPASSDRNADTGVSHSPLNLGGSSETWPAAATPAPSRPAVKKPVTAAPGGDRITGVRIFFTKLHAGAVDFLSEQIAEWLRKNPEIKIKSTDTTVGEIQAKKTEPNLIITVWF